MVIRRPNELTDREKVGNPARTPCVKYAGHAHRARDSGAGYQGRGQDGAERVKPA